MRVPALLAFWPLIFGKPAVAGGGASLYLENAVYKDDLTTGPATATFQLTSGGAAAGAPAFSGDDSYNWLTGGTPGDYEVRITMTVGTVSSGPAAGSWWNLGTTRTWVATRTVNGSKVCEFLAEIRAVGTTTILASATIGLEAYVGGEA